MNITEKQLELIRNALRVAQYGIDCQPPSDQVALDTRDVQLAYHALDCVRRGNITTKLAYHYKNDSHGWRHVRTSPINAPDWHAQDRWAYAQMVEQGTTSLVMGWNMWELVQERAQ